MWGACGFFRCSKFDGFDFDNLWDSISLFESVDFFMQCPEMGKEQVKDKKIAQKCHSSDKIRILNICNELDAFISHRAVLHVIKVNMLNNWIKI